MSLSQEQIAKIILIRSIEEGDPKALPENTPAAVLDAMGQGHIGIDWLERRASYLFERLSTRYRLLIELASIPAQWTVPLCVAAFLMGAAVNLLGPVQEIHVVRNPVFLLVIWNLCVYLALLLARLLARAGFSADPAKSATKVSQDGTVPPRSEMKPSWTLRLVLPRLWHFFLRMTSGFREPKTYGEVVRRFSANWLEVGAALSTARWKAMLHLGALMIAMGAIGGMYLRGLFQDYRVSWASTFITREESVEQLVKIVFGPSLFVARLARLDLADQISVARLFSPQGDAADGWIHLFAITVVLAVVLPRALLALWQRRKIGALTRGLSLSLDDYYGPLIEAPLRSAMGKQVEIAALRFAGDMAGFVGTALYEQRIVPALSAFRESGGKIADLNAQLRAVGEAFLPELKAYIATSAAPAFQKDLSARAGELIKSMGADFNIGDPGSAFDDVRVAMTQRAQAGIADPLSAAVGVSVAASMSLTFAAVGGGLGSELGIAIISTLLGTTGPVGFVIGLVGGAVAAGAALWLGKDSVAAAVHNLPLPAAVVKTALWESRFQRLIAEGRAQCEESVRLEAARRLNALQPEITDAIVARARSLWAPAAPQSA
jgi:hypothetical protein